MRLLEKQEFLSKSSILIFDQFYVQKIKNIQFWFKIRIVGVCQFRH